MLLLRGELAEGLAQGGIEEDGVVAKAALSHGGKGDGALHLALRREGVPVGEGAGDGAGKVGGAGGLAPEVFQEQAVAAHIVQTLAAVAGGIDAGGSGQGVHAEAGIVRDGGKICRLADGLGLEHGVLGKRRAGLLYFKVDAKRLGGHHFHPEAGQNVRHFPQFFLILGCQYEFHKLLLTALPGLPSGWPEAPGFPWRKGGPAPAAQRG